MPQQLKHDHDISLPHKKEKEEEERASLGHAPCAPL
jgi:hypothetical protein